MKKIAFVLCVSAALVCFGCASTPKSKLKDATGKVEVIEHKGTAWGAEQPGWVLTKKGKSLDFLKTWTDQVDARADIAASINQSVIDFVKGQEFGSEEEMNQVIEHISGRFSEASLNGLVRETDWWSKTRQLAEGSEYYVTQYNYMVIYSMDDELFEKHIKDAYKDLEKKSYMKKYCFI